MEGQEKSRPGPLDWLGGKSAAPAPEGEGLDANGTEGVDKRQERTIDPEKLSGASGRVGTGKKRGRPPGPGKQKIESAKSEADAAGPDSGPREKAKAVYIDPAQIAGLEKILLSIHHHYAVTAQAPEMELKEEEAKMLAETSAKVWAHYFPKVNVSNEVWDVGMLGYTLWSIYAPRIAAGKIRKAAAKWKSQQTPPANPAGSSAANVAKPSAPVSAPRPIY